MGNETSAPNGVEGEGGGGGGMPPLPPDQAAAGSTTAAAQYGVDAGQQQQQQQQVRQPPTPTGSQHSRTSEGQTTGPASTSALQSRQQQFKNAAKRGVERTKANMEKTRALVKQGTKGQGGTKPGKRGSVKAQQQAEAPPPLAAAQLAGGVSAPFENGGSGPARGVSQQTAPLHHQHSAPAAAYGGGGGQQQPRSTGQKVPHGGHYQQQQSQAYHQQQQYQQQQQERGGYDYQQQQAAAAVAATPQRPDPYYQHQRAAAPSPPPSGNLGKADPRRSPKNTALVDVMYASETGHQFPGADGGASGSNFLGESAMHGSGLGAAAYNQMADTAAAFAASMSSQFGQLGLSSPSETLGSGGSATLQQQQQAAEAAVAVQHQQMTAAAATQQQQHAQQQQQHDQQPALDSMGSSGGEAYKSEGLSNDEDEWKNAWDDDEEESDGGDDGDEGEDDEEDDEDDVLAVLGGPLAVAAAPPAAGGKPPKAGGAAGAAAGFGAVGPAVGSHQPFRPAMDGGHSSSTTMGGGQQQWPAAPGGYGGPLSSQQLLPPSPVPQQQQQEPTNAAYYPASGRPAQQPGGGGGGGSTAAMPPLPPGTTIDAARGGMVPGYPAQSQSSSRLAVVTASPHESEEDVLTKEADRMLSAGNGAVQWDMSAGAAAAAAAVAAPEKPCIEMFFPMLRVLGKGSFGKVVLVQKRTGKERGGLFAMKILRKAHLVKRRQIERTKTERKVLSLVDHPFIMKLHYAFQTDDKLYLVLDYCPGGELFFHLSRFRRFPERVARFFAAELLLALGHLHKRGIIYRDLKPENVLLDADGHVKLGDFGLAKDGIRHPCAGATSMCGTPEYMAPEVLGQHGHGFCVDYWGLGMLTFEMMTGLPPWYTTDRTKLFRRLRSAPLDVPSFFSPRSASFASALLERDPRRRLGVQGLRSAMSHEFFRDVDWSSLRFRRVEAPIRPCEGWTVPVNTPGGGPSNPGSAAPGAGVSASSSQNQISQNELDVATANFDPQFTRMKVDTEDAGRGDEGDGGGDGKEGEETLNEHTFVGFTFDEMDPTTRGGSTSRGSEGARVRGGPPPADPRSYRSSRRS